MRTAQRLLMIGLLVAALARPGQAWSGGGAPGGWTPRGWTPGGWAPGGWAPGGGGGGGEGADCVAAAAAAERDWALPDGLLLAIGLAESGQRDPATARLVPYAFSINVGGADARFASAPYAVGAVAALRDRGVRSIDVGCFQVNLHHHPGAFASLPEAFDARANAGYAAAFLRRLFVRTGSWNAAIAAYHSADPARGDPYLARVLRLWQPPSAAGAVAAESRNGGPARPVTRPDPHVIRIAAVAAAIPVYTPATLPASLRAALGILTQP